MPSTDKNQPVTLAEVLELPADEWVNGLLTVTISHIEQKNGNRGPFFVAKLADPDNPGTTMRATFFGRKAFNYGGKVCTLSGALKTSEYNGVPELKAMGKYQVNIVGEAGGSADSSRSAPASGGRGSGGKDAYNAGAMGQRIGNALNNACHLIGRTLGRESITREMAYLRSPQFANDVWVCASWILRAGNRLEAGNLARTDDNGNVIEGPPPAAKKQEPPPPPPKTEPPPPARKPEPGPGGAAFDPNSDPTEDVPF